MRFYLGYSRGARLPLDRWRLALAIAVIGPCFAVQFGMLGCATQDSQPANRPLETGGQANANAEPSEAVPIPNGERRRPPEGGYALRLDVSTSSAGQVDLHVETNIPGTIEVMAGLSLRGQKSDDVFIGKSERLRITQGEGRLTLDTSDLPKGAYDAEATLYPRWGLQDAESRSTGISKEIKASVPLNLSGSVSASDFQFKENGQKWVMLNADIGKPWRPADWRRFGKFEELAVEGLNPRIIKAYYFPRIDMTIFVNTFKGEISHWRIGRATH